MKQYSVIVTEYGSVTRISVLAEDDFTAEQIAKEKPGVSKVHKVWQLVSI